MSDPAYLRRRPDGVELAVKVTPKAGRAAVEEPVTDAAGQAWLAVKVCEPPEDGKATEAVRRLLAQRCGLPAGAVSLLAGATARWKRLLLAGDADEIAGRLAGAAGPSRGRKP
ncbi:MAG: DUF167 family protein [Geminicoccaceae bacterium]